MLLYIYWLLDIRLQNLQYIILTASYVMMSMIFACHYQNRMAFLLLIAD